MNDFVQRIFSQYIPRTRYAIDALNRQLDPVNNAKQALQLIGNTDIGRGFIRGFTTPPEQQNLPAEIKNNEQLAQSFGNAFANATPEGDIAQVGAHALPFIGLGIKGIQDVSKGENVLNKALDVTQNVAPKFEGFNDLTTKALEFLKGSREVTPQHIQNIVKMPGIKQAEGDTINTVLQKYLGQPKIPVKQFAEDVKGELLPLDRINPVEREKGMTGQTFLSPRWERVTLKENRGNVANYSEHVYESPIKTSAASHHYDQNVVPNYFAHTRVEDLADTPPRAAFGNVNGKEALVDRQTGEVIEYINSPEDFKRFQELFDKPGSTRRVIELQSDLFQKGRLEGEIGSKGDMTYKQIREALTPQEWEQRLNLYEKNRLMGLTDEEKAQLGNIDRKAEDKFFNDRKQELSKLKPYENTWHERVIREEVKKAAQDGKTKLQFPTGETAMKIEGLNRANAEGDWMVHNAPGDYNPIGVLTDSPVRMAVGNDISRGGYHYVITDVLGDGKFKAVPKEVAISQKSWKIIPDTRLSGEKIFLARNSYTGEVTDFATKNEAQRYIEASNNGYEETFDISGKVDTKNPIYKFYESEVGKYLQKKYDAKRITDPQGVQWWELPVNKQHAQAPVEAYGAGILPLIFPQRKKKNDSN